MEHVISMETSKGQAQSSVVLNETNQNQSIIANEENEREISNERQEKNEQAADWESTAKTYLGTILDGDDRLIIENEFPNFRCPKVPPRLRNSERSKDYFDPKIVSFGPYHHGKAKLQATQMIKTKVMRNFISGHGKNIEDLYIKVRLLIDDARSWYDNGDGSMDAYGDDALALRSWYDNGDGSMDAYGDDALALMMLQDGCFILCLIEWQTLTFQKYTIKNLDLMLRYVDSQLIIHNHLSPLDHPYLYRDMLLLENQIPFVVLKVLMSNIYNNENEGLTMMKSYLYMIYWGEFQKQDTQDKDEKKHNHLLGLLKTVISKPRKKTKLENKDMDVTRYLQSSGSVSDLQAKGINLKPSNSISLLSGLLKGKPKSISLQDVDFRSGFFAAELKLPPLFGGNNIQVYYRNLIAFEMCDSFKDFTVASYIKFMNSLIDNPGDVKALRSKRIILHSLNNDEEMFKMLKDLSSPDWISDYSIHQDVRVKIERHYNNKIKIWIADIFHEYFSHPWSAISLLAAVVVLILTFLQTFFTIYPRKA